MKKLFALMLVFALSFSMLAGCSSSDEDTSDDSTDTVELTIMAAASLTDALTDIEEAYEEAYDVELNISYASSGELQTQIEEGADADVFISAAQSKMDTLEDEDLIDSDTVSTLLLNQLVVIAPEGSDVEIDDLTDLLSFDGYTIAMGDPDSVPAGAYAKEALEYYDMYDELENSDTVDIVTGSKVTEVTSYVESGSADLGFVYYSDAVSSDSVDIVYTVPEDSYSTISYPSGIVSSSENKDEAQDFLDYLQSDDAVAIFESYGFTMYED